METQFVCQKIMVKQVIVQQRGTATGNMLQPSYVSVDNMLQHVQTFHTEHYSLIIY